MFIEHQRIRFTPVPGGNTSITQRLTLDDGTDVFAKLHEKDPVDLLSAEQQGLAWLKEAAAPVPKVLAGSTTLLVTEWINSASPTAAGSASLGRALAKMHQFGADSWGAPWNGFISTLPLDNTLDKRSWSDWFGERRLWPFLRLSVDNGALSISDARRVERLISRLDVLAGPTEPVSRLHGDLWPGNVLWAADGQAWLIDPAAHGGHRETDVASLMLWGGIPSWDDFITSYEDVWPLADGWRDRVELHQLFLLLVHTCLFGQLYRDEVISAVSRYE